MSTDIENTAIGAEQIRKASVVVEEKEAVLARAATSRAAEENHEGGLPTEEELRTLRRVSDKIPWNIITIGFIELCERFSFYGTIAVFTNFIQQPLPAGSTTGADPNGQPGAMGMGQRASTGLNTFNSFWQYTMPLFGAYLADTYFGRYKTIALALVVDIAGHLIVLTSGLPAVITHPLGAMSAFIVGMIMMGVGTGGFKPNVNPLIVEQLPSQTMRVITTQKGERVIVDPAVTASRVYHYFYMFINIGALLGQLGMVYAEMYIGFWLAYLLPTIMLCLCPLVLWWGRKRYNRVPPTGSVLGKAMKLFMLANKGRWSLNPVGTYKRLHDGTFWDNVKPSRFTEATRPTWMTFDDAWVDEVRRGFSACSVFSWYPFFWLCYNQMSSNLISQAAVLELHGIPNDVITNLNPLSLVIMIPLLDFTLYPFLRKMRIQFTPVKKITAGFFVSTIAMVWTAVVQHYIYKTSECGVYASGKLPNGEQCPPAPINVWIQSGSYILTGFAEICASITSLEYAYSKAPTNMRSMVQAIALSVNAISSAMGFALVSLSADPLLVWNYGIVAVLCAVGGMGFWFNFRKLDQDEDKLNMLPAGQYASGDDNNKNNGESKA